MEEQKQANEPFQIIAVLDGAHTRTVRQVSWQPNSTQEGATLATSSFDATAAVWNRGQGENSWEVCAQLEGHENEVKGVAWSNDGKYLATSSRDKSVWIWESEGAGED